MVMPVAYVIAPIRIRYGATEPKVGVKFHAVARPAKFGVGRPYSGIPATFVRPVYVYLQLWFFESLGNTPKNAVCFHG